ncbi:putative remorin [Helianthus annuus]|uniref:Remorin n=1 Tax=Helianthus annuus TaxID=4232 RepID=A0A251TKN0_HELAN|nr:uncharacterized protein LOC110885164 [Helianthus annuus]KAF5798915.1 putative remorin [Helianthus annuus]KAJ0550452.1 putative remorin [Helianthus annuus]KAJ0563408.1 putative remorin [Helianthus annuus]KAJ0728744.1 putative remorin [Helianthus annuus]KAJ0731502.1 putative remorin [Helianthus annuus]
MNKDPSSVQNAGTDTSPGSPLPSCNNKQRRTSINVLMAINNGRVIPSKWDDAERWITSPVSGTGVCKNLTPPTHRRPKAKSGPLGPTPGDAYFSIYPGFPLVEGGIANNVFASSPLTTGVLVPSGYSFGGTDANPVPDHIDYRCAPTELFIESSYPDSQDEKIDGNNATYGVSRRDMATQMSPVDSPESALKVSGMLSTSAPPVEKNSQHFAREVVRDVQVDKRVTMTKQPERHKEIMEKNELTEINDPTLTWSPTDGAMELSKIQKEEARITAWENLQIAKAEASIRKLEMKLEKKKSKSMDKIMNKLRIAQMKAQEMRKRMSANEAPKSSLKVMSFSKINLNSCFRFKSREVLKDEGPEAVNMDLGDVCFQRWKMRGC